MKNNQKSPDKRRNTSTNSNLDDLGLEPPKIYRESQKKIVEHKNDKKSKPVQKRKSGEQNLTRNEKRARQTKKRKKRNKLRKILIYLVFALIAISLFVVLSLTAFFHIEGIEVTGNEKYTVDEVLTHCTIDVGENLFLADTSSAKETLEQNLPYIFNADIHRKFPSKIEIVITESDSNYYIDNENGTFTLLDANLKVLEKDSAEGRGIKISNAKPESITVGTVITFEDENIAQCINTMVTVINDNNFTDFTEIYCNNLVDNNIVYQNRIRFKLGTLDDIENKVYQGLTSCEKLNESSPNAEGTMTISGGKEIYFTEK